MFIGFIVGGTAKNNTALIVSCAFIGFVGTHCLGRICLCLAIYKDETLILYKNYRVLEMPSSQLSLCPNYFQISGDIRPSSSQVRLRP
jgi:hypothetical protein